MGADIKLTFEEKVFKIKNNGGFYLPQIEFERLERPRFWAYVFSDIEHYDDIVFEYHEDSMGFSSFLYKPMKQVFIEMGYMMVINNSFKWERNENIPVGTMFIYEREKLRIMLELNK